MTDPSPDRSGKPCEIALIFFWTKKSDQRKLLFCPRKNKDMSKLEAKSWKLLQKKNDTLSNAILILSIFLNYFADSPAFFKYGSVCMS
jgi:hypothetical protein